MSKNVPPKLQTNVIPFPAHPGNRPTRSISARVSNGAGQVIPVSRLKEAREWARMMAELREEMSLAMCIQYHFGVEQTNDWLKERRRRKEEQRSD